MPGIYILFLPASTPPSNLNDPFYFLLWVWRWSSWSRIGQESELVTQKWRWGCEMQFPNAPLRNGRLGAESKQSRNHMVKPRQVLGECPVWHQAYLEASRWGGEECRPSQPQLSLTSAPRPVCMEHKSCAGWRGSVPTGVHREAGWCWGLARVMPWFCHTLAMWH